MILLLPHLGYSTQDQLHNTEGEGGSANTKLNYWDLSFFLQDSSLSLAEMEISAFFLQGKKNSDRLEILDFGILSQPDDSRLLPLFKLIESLEIKWEFIDNRIVFTPDKSSRVIIDPANKLIIIDEIEKKSFIKKAISDISNRPDLYLLPETIAKIFSFQIHWDNDQYAFVANTQFSLDIWKQPEFKSALTVQTKHILEKLPEAHGVAFSDKKKYSLDFVTVAGSVNYNVYNNSNSSTLLFSPLRQTLYGGFLGGKYKFDITEPINEESDNTEQDFVTLDTFDWRYLSDTTMSVIGDLQIGLHEQIYPSVSFYGVKVNGLIGLGKDKLKISKNKLKASNFFAGSQVFEGIAPLGSTVELFINNYLIETQEVQVDEDLQSPNGLYRFENIYLSPGTLNNIRIVIHYPDGEKNVIEKSILGSDDLVSKNVLAYLVAAGTSRENNILDSKGVFSGGRFFYGLSQNCTIGTSLAYQENFFSQVEETNFFKNDIQFQEVDIPSTGEEYTEIKQETDHESYPISTLNMGINLTWKPSDQSLFNFDFSWAQQEKDVIIDDYALNFHFIHKPDDNSIIQTNVFRIEPNYFNGVNLDYKDMQGASLFSSLRFPDLFKIKASCAYVSDNVMNERDDTLALKIMQGEIQFSILPRNNLYLDLQYRDASWNETPLSLATFKFTNSFWKNFRIDGSYSIGDDVFLQENQSLLNVLNIPSSPNSKENSLEINAHIPRKGDVKFKYLEQIGSSTFSLAYSDILQDFFNTSFSTEFGYQLESEQFLFKSNIFIPLKNSRRSKLLLETSYNDDEWKIGLSIILNETFSYLGGKINHINSQDRIQPEGINVYGKVFLDSNGNAVLDSEEKGVENIKVLFSGNRRVAFSKSNGNFILPITDSTTEGTVFLAPHSIPAIYSITHGKQIVHLSPGEMTKVNFGLTPLHSVTGIILTLDEGITNQPIGGVQVNINSKDTGKQLGNSITAYDGSYYLSDLRPGKYTLTIDSDSVPLEYSSDIPIQFIEVFPLDEPQELSIPDIILPLKN